ncbi:MAG: L-serine ammonia-lyase, iron-sulfur-dependent, subunit beta [Chthoniobacterales bacterium]|nr:L-serine ammonia-lyase, iron-sulfur-dependent, subunit beta [Chthoniobacterales bacterium]
MGLSVFEIIGPVMTGPSSSHTAGACRIGWAARQVLGEAPCRAEIGLHGSFAATGDGHGTKEALAAGLLGFAPDDERLPRALELAPSAGLQIVFREVDLGAEAHPNSADLSLEGSTRREKITGSSTGGGAVLVTAIDGHDLHLTGRLDTLLLWHNDTPGFLARITALLACVEINVATIRTSRTERGEGALTAVEIDGRFPQTLLALLDHVPSVQRHAVLPVLPGY